MNYPDTSQSDEKRRGSAVTRGVGIGVMGTGAYHMAKGVVKHIAKRGGFNKTRIIAGAAALAIGKKVHTMGKRDQPTSY